MIKTFSHHTKHCPSHHGQAALFTAHTVEQVGENRAGVSSAGESRRAPRDLWDQGMPPCAQGSCREQHGCSSSPKHPQPQYQLQCVLGLTLALGRRTCTEHQWTGARFGLWGMRVRQQNSINTSSKHACFQLQWPLIQLVASTQAAAVTYLSLQWVRKGLYEKSGQQFSLTGKVWKTKNFVSGSEGCSVPGLAFWSTHLHSVCFPHLSQV